MKKQVKDGDAGPPAGELSKSAYQVSNANTHVRAPIQGFDIICPSALPSFASTFVIIRILFCIFTCCLLELTKKNMSFRSGCEWKASNRRFFIEVDANIYKSGCERFRVL